MKRPIFTAIAISAAVFLPVGFLAGYTLPYPEEETEEADEEAVEAPAPVPAADPCDQSAAAIARRNVFWSMWGGQAPDQLTPDAALAAAVGVVIKTDVTAEQRNSGLSMYMTKSALYFTPEQLTQAQEDLAGDSPDKRLAMFQHIAAIDLDAARLIGCVLADTARVNAYLAGQPVPLETAP